MRVFVLVASTLSVLMTEGRASGKQERSLLAPETPLIEFVAIDDDSARYVPLTIENCGYYLRVVGYTGHEPTSRLGAAAQLKGDTLRVWIDSYRTSEVVVHDLERARWTLRVGGVEFHHVEIIAGVEHVTRDTTVPAEDQEARVRGCSSGY